VEIGGFNPKFFSQNPPVEFLEEWARKQAMFNLLLAGSLPRARVRSAEARPLTAEPGVFEVTAVLTNEGFLPTALEMARRVKIVSPDRAELSFTAKEAEVVGGRPVIDLGWLGPGEEKEARWKVKVLAPAGAEVEVAVLSTRGGVDRKKLRLAPAPSPVLRGADRPKARVPLRSFPGRLNLQRPLGPRLPAHASPGQDPGA